MMNGWKKISLGDVAEIDPPRTLKKGMTTPFIPMDALPEHARSPARIDKRTFTGSGTKFQNGDILLARITPCLENGKTAFVSGLPETYVAHGSTEYIVLTGKAGITDSLFLYYLARSEEFGNHAITHMEGTSGRQRVPSDAVEKYSFPLPPLPEQKAIARILGTLDDKIELNRRMNATLDMIALCREAGLPAPDFRQDGGMFIQTLSRPVARQTGQAAPQATQQVAMQDNGLIAKAFSEFVAALASQTGQATGQATGQVAGQAANALLNFFTTLRTAKEIQDFLGLSHRETFLNNYLNPAIEAGLLERTIPEKPTSPNQRYRLTAKGRPWLAKTKENTEGLGHGE
jgi:hypothetical protein